MGKKAAVIFITALICFGLFRVSRAGRESDVVPVSVVAPGTEDIFRSVTVDGRIDAVRTATLTAEAAADITKIYVRAGDQVLKGQVLMELSSMSRPAQTAPDGEELVESVLSAFLETGSLDIPSETILEKLIPALTEGEGSGGTDVPGSVVSPIDGVVTSIVPDEREGVQRGAALAVVSDKSRMRATLQLSENDVAKVMPGMPTELSVGSAGKKYAGIVTEILPTVRQKLSLTGTPSNYVEVIVEIYHPDDALLVGSSASGQIFTSKKQGALTLPYAAVTQDDDGVEVVYVVDRGRASARPVETGLELSRGIEIVSGVYPGERVILNPGAKIKDGARVVEAG